MTEQGKTPKTMILGVEDVVTVTTYSSASNSQNPVSEAADGEPENDQRQAGSSWLPVPLTKLAQGLANGTLTKESPSVGTLWHPSNGRTTGLLYRGRVNGIAGDSGCGKTWTGIAVACGEMMTGIHVVYVDFEDSPLGMVSRLKACGVDDATLTQLFTYIQPSEKLSAKAWEDLDDVLTQLQPSLVVFDSTGEGLSIAGANPMADDDVAKWFREVPRRVARHQCRPAVLLLDHITKAASETSGLWPIGSHRKRAAIDGVQYMQRIRKPFAQGVAGEARLKVAKDRHGTFLAGDEVAALSVTPQTDRDADAVKLTLLDVRGDGNSEPPHQLQMMERVSEWLETRDSETKRQIREKVTGNERSITDALDKLVDEGYVTTSKGRGGYQVYSSVKPYRQADEDRHQS